MILTRNQLRSRSRIPGFRLDQRCGAQPQISPKAVDDFEKAVESKRKGEPAKVVELLEESSSSRGLLRCSRDAGYGYQSMTGIGMREAIQPCQEPQHRIGRALINLSSCTLRKRRPTRQKPLVTGVMYDDSLHILQDAVRMELAMPRSTIFSG